MLKSLASEDVGERIEVLLYLWTSQIKYVFLYFMLFYIYISKKSIHSSQIVNKIFS